jgi:hypothetical protein
MLAAESNKGVSMASEAPLAGVRVVEFLGLGPAPFASMLLADLGAEVLAIARPGTPPPAMADNRPVLEIDLKSVEGLALAQRLVSAADVVVEGFRPGVMDRLGLGPEATLTGNSWVVYARMTGWGQHGPLALRAAHDLTYIALTGALHHAARAGGTTREPVGDFGPGGMYLVNSVLATLLRRERTCHGEVGDEVRIVDESFGPVPVGEVGEIVTRGPSQFVGYRDPAHDLTAILRGGWFRTGYIGGLDADGYLAVTDRPKDLIIRGDENIASKEVEDVLATLSIVRHVAVVAAPDSRYGEGARRGAGAVRPQRTRPAEGADPARGGRRPAPRTVRQGAQVRAAGRAPGGHPGLSVQAGSRSASRACTSSTRSTRLTFDEGVRGRASTTRTWTGTS